MTRTPGLTFPAILLAALSLSIGWGVRGQWGHEYGAMIPGALAAMAVCLMSGREDWRRRVAYFAFFGALGWSFGGSMSYGHVIGYAASAHFPSVVYGLFCLFVIGFLWGAIGGAGTALPAVFDRDRLAELFPPGIMVFLLWWLEGAVPGMLLDRKLIIPADLAWMDWYDTDWLAALLAVEASLILWLRVPRLRRACSLVLHMSVGWWVGFLGLVVLLGIRMTPPRGDNWAGVLGMTAGMLVYFWREGFHSVVFASLVTGFFGGLGFSGGDAAKLAGMSLFEEAAKRAAIQINWHSLLEQSFGFISGIGAAVTMGMLSTRTPRLAEEPPTRRWTEPFAVAFTLIVITFLNIRKNVHAVWVPTHGLPKVMYGLAIQWWFDLTYLTLAVVALVLIVRHARRPLAILPASWLGRGQLFYLVLLWWVVLGNLARVLPFQPGRLTTEGLIHINTCLCTILVLCCPRDDDGAELQPASDWRRLAVRAAWATLAATVIAIVLETAVVRGMWGETPSRPYNVRFGPNATTSGPK